MRANKCLFSEPDSWVGDPLSDFQLVLPVCNEEARIEVVLRHYCSICCHILVIDNFSTDSTAKIVSTFEKARLIRIANQGTTESRDWWLQASRHFYCDFVFFGSCSEFASGELLKAMSALVHSPSVDMVAVNRASRTGGFNTDPLYCTPSSLLMPRIRLPAVVRFVRWKSIDPAMISPHDNFRSQSHCVLLKLEANSERFRIVHLRPYPSMSTIKKHNNYARQYSLVTCRSNVFRAIADSILRALLDTARLLRSLLAGTWNKAILLEYVMRLLMHCQVVFYAFKHSICGIEP